MVNLLKQDYDWIRWPGSRDILVHIRRVAVEFELQRVIDNQSDIRYSSVIARNAADNCNHLEIRSNDSVLTVSQVPRPTMVPRHAIFRDNYGVGNQTLLGLYDEPTVPGDRVYTLLTHGYYSDQPAFVCLGIPSPAMDGWICRVNLMLEPHQINLPETEKITDGELVALKSHLQKSVKLEE